MSGYDRDLFPHWEIQTGECNTREIVLERDGENVVQDADNCKAESGDWYSVYDDEEFDDASEIDIDHVVPLANAWRVSQTANPLVSRAVLFFLKLIVELCN